jgi:hypothetical protein
MVIKKKPTHGGKRTGAGRPKTKEKTKVMRVPESKVEAVKKVIKPECKFPTGPVNGILCEDQIDNP